MKRLTLKLSLLFLLIIFWLSPLTSSNYYDTETSSENTISAGSWDTTAPIISSISHLVATPLESNDTKATISWTTNEEADSNLYWTTNNIIWDSVSDTTYKTNHSLEIFGLSTDTTYYYYVTSSDRAGNITVSSDNNFITDSMTPEDFTPTTDIVMNEFLPNPTGDDFAPMPGGEWVELYNNSSTTSYNLTGWLLSVSSNPGYRSLLTPVNSSSMNIAPEGFVVVYRNSDSFFEILNSGDTIQLHDPTDAVVDQYTYTASQIAENKSIARYPDGSGTWFDPIPSPLGANILEDWQLKQPEINYSFDGQKLSFEVLNVDKYKQIEYQLTYNSDSGEQGVIGTNQLSGQPSYKKDDIVFGTCSTGGTCVYHSNLNNILLKIILTNSSEVTNLEKIIN